MTKRKKLKGRRIQRRQKIIYIEIDSDNDERQKKEQRIQQEATKFKLKGKFEQ